jgi:hypothetical protein
MLTNLMRILPWGIMDKIRNKRRYGTRKEDLITRRFLARISLFKTSGCMTTSWTILDPNRRQPEASHAQRLTSRYTTLSCIYFFMT